MGGEAARLIHHEFKTKPFDHQLAEFNRSALSKSRAIFWEQGTGKTHYGINSLAAARRGGLVSASVIVAPPGVERNWVTDEFPAHWPDDLPYHPMVWSTSAADSKWHKAEASRLLGSPFPVLALTYDAWMTEAGRAVARELILKRPTYLHCDESAHLKTHNSQRTANLTKAAQYAEITRIYSGTPVDNSPFDVYSQVNIVDPGFWMREFGLPGYLEFTHFFGLFAKAKRRASAEEMSLGKDGREYPVLVGYQNIGLLREALKKISDRVLKDDVLDLPEKLYTKRYYEMHPEQRRVYEALENEYMADFPDDPEALVTAELPIVRMLRLQQVLCGYVPKDGDEEPTQLIDPKHNPRLDATTQFVLEAGNLQTMVVGQYRLDVDLLMQRLRDEGRKPARYDGAVNADDRERAKIAFKAGDVSDLVGNQQVLAEGLTFVNCHTMAIHSNAYRMGKRKQIEDRVHRIGQLHACLYGDMACRGTRDEVAIRILQKKHRVSQEVLGDAPTEWL